MSGDNIITGNQFGGNWFDGILFILDFFRSCFKFLLNAIVSLLSSLGKLAQSIFTGEFFGYIMQVFDTLSYYLGSTTTIILMGLFGFAFMRIVFGFIMRLIKGQVNDHNTIISFKRLPK